MAWNIVKVLFDKKKNVFNKNCLILKQIFNFWLQQMRIKSITFCESYKHFCEAGASIYADMGMRISQNSWPP